MAKQGQEKATIYDVADAAGVGISTVSRVLNDSPNVADKTRAKVLAAIEELQFRPSRMAKTLAQPAHQTLAVAIPTFTTPFHNELLKGIRYRLKEVEVDLLLCDLAWAEPEQTLRRFLEHGAMDGLLLAGLSVDDRLGEELQKLGMPVVLIGSRWEGLDSFYWDETAGARLAVNHLVDKGHRRIAMITTPMEGPPRDARIRGYLETLEAADLERDEDLIAVGRTEKHAGFSEESGYEAMEELLARESSVTAVFASSDVQAIGAWQAMRRRGIRVPEDIALVGYDDIKVSRFIGLTSVAQHMHEVGERVTDLLLRRIKGGGDAETVSQLLMPELVVRTTT